MKIHAVHGLIDELAKLVHAEAGRVVARSPQAASGVMRKLRMAEMRGVGGSREQRCTPQGQGPASEH